MSEVIAGICGRLVVSRYCQYRVAMFFAGSERMITTKKHLTILKRACNDGVRFSVLHGEPSRTHSRSFGEFLLADSQTLGGPGICVACWWQPRTWFHWAKWCQTDSHVGHNCLIFPSLAGRGDIAAHADIHRNPLATSLEHAFFTAGLL